jgi:F-type H+-transporting ATPase subunit gamma
MASLKAIKTKIRSIDKTRKVTKAMEAVSAAKMRKAQDRAFSGRSYAKAAVAVLTRLSGGALTRSVFMASRDVKKMLYIVITSDKGLAGALNSGVLKAAAADIRARNLMPQDVRVIAVGRKANEFFTKRGYAVDAYYPNTDDGVNADRIETAVEDALILFRTGAVDAVAVVFQNFISTFEQRPTVRTMLPFSVEELSRIVKDIVPARGRGSEVPVRLEAPPNYTIEPSAEEVLDTLIPKLAAIFVYHALLESQASEHSARMVSMKSASDKARDVAKELTLDFNKARQAGITREVSEIIGGIEAMA